MVKLRRVNEANLPSSSLSVKCRETIKSILGVIPFPKGEDALYLKAVYFCFSLGNFDMKVSEDVLIEISEEDITVRINRSCNPEGTLVKTLVEEITPQNPFAKALTNVCNHIAVEVQKVGSEWCRVGNYKSLKIESPYIDRFKAFVESNPDIRVPGVAMDQLKVLKDTPEYYKALNSMQVLPQEEINTLNSRMQEFISNFGPSIRPPKVPMEPPKPMSDRRRKNQLDKLVNLGIGGGKDKPKPRDPRLLQKP